MSIFIIMFSLFLLLAGIVLIVKPELLFTLLNNNSEKLEIYGGAILTRLILGALLIYFSGASRYPLTILTIGWLSIIAAAVFALIGWNKFKVLMNWVLFRAKPLSPVAGVISISFGAFLFHAFT